MDADPQDLRGHVLWAPRAWVAGRWHDGVQLAIDATGHWREVNCGVAPAPEAIRLQGPALPGLVDAHSHAFQRAFAGLAETRSGEHDDFWSWRDRMYGVALRITPSELRAVARQLCTELLQGGYTQLCEFHYLHHQPDGRAYDHELEMAWAVADGAADAGIGLTLLPVLYERAGFMQPELRPDQRRFATDARCVLRMRDGIRAAKRPNVNAGVAIHSLRAAAPESIRALMKGCDGDEGPIHIHVAEQTAEVDDCLAATGRRPIEWLAHEGLLDARWQLVHATHTTPAEIDAVAASGAGVVLCPSTEANLGDGLPDLARWLASSTPLTLGSDSHVERDWPAELRLLEYGQRLTQRRRNVCAAPELGEPSTAARLFKRVLAGGAAAAGLRRWGLEAGARADLLVLPAPTAPLVEGISGDPLDTLVFAPGASPAFAQVLVAGRRVEP
ncbi:formimidoylglutamate deiminase [Rivibacter subsaxonicus]|uniref:Formimidoylglutamate deiminase n=1 Tax=Rivibacter subsaxonicus TaxID=457575 RepID=A0A4Q7VZM7_9BURK|nr:formimidoylglutamate deiminase [Rivibacter subsaxonicus]RZU02240.1 formimidoylglutamate deiminase [Rivibacter subsaxonicus]